MHERRSESFGLLRRCQFVLGAALLCFSSACADTESHGGTDDPSASGSLTTDEQVLSQALALSPSDVFALEGETVADLPCQIHWSGAIGKPWGHLELRVAEEFTALSYRGTDLVLVDRFAKCKNLTDVLAVSAECSSGARQTAVARTYRMFTDGRLRAVIQASMDVFEGSGAPVIDYIALYRYDNAGTLFGIQYYAGDGPALGDEVQLTAGSIFRVGPSCEAAEECGVLALETEYDWTTSTSFTTACVPKAQPCTEMVGRTIVGTFDAATRTASFEGARRNDVQLRFESEPDLSQLAIWAEWGNFLQPFEMEGAPQSLTETHVDEPEFVFEYGENGIEGAVMRSRLGGGPVGSYVYCAPGVPYASGEGSP